MPKPLIANERFYYAGRNVEMGEQFNCDDTDVDLLTHAIKPMARIPDRIEPEPEPEPAPEARKESYHAEQARAARYRRRDVKAED